MVALTTPLPLLPHRVVVNADSESSSVDEYVVDVVERGDGNTVVGIVCPSPPPDPDKLPATPVVDRFAASAVMLPDVPAFDWSNGCSATSAAMLFGYYDRTGYPNMYAGPTNGGVCPLDNSSWAYGTTPLSATRQGYDGLAGRGHVDDYYGSYGGSTDPYYGNWMESGYSDCTADFMGTNQWYNWQNTDGATTFYYTGGNAPLSDYSGSEGGSAPRRDGMHGMRLFSESRGYTVLQNYNQFIYGYNGISAGFTFQQYCQEIDAGRPVIIQVAGHSMLGVGYDTAGNTVYLHDTWDHATHSMTWGGSYSGMQQYGVGVLQLEEAADVVGEPQAHTDGATGVTGTAATIQGTVLDDGGESCEYRFRYGDAPSSYTVSTSWTGSVGAGDSFSADVTGLDKGQTYYFVAEVRNSADEDSGSEQQFVTVPDAPSGLSALADGGDSIDLSWTLGEGAGSTQIQRKGGAYPVDRNDGVTVYYGSGTSASDAGLEPDTTYCYSAWSEVGAGGTWSGICAQATATTGGVLPVVSTLDASGVVDDPALLNGVLVDDRGAACEYRFEYGMESGGPYLYSYRLDRRRDRRRIRSTVTYLTWRRVRPTTSAPRRAAAKTNPAGIEMFFATLPAATLLLCLPRLRERTRSSFRGRRARDPR